MSELKINPTSDRSLNKSTVPGTFVTDAFNNIAAVGAVRDAPAGTMSGTTPDTQLSVGTTPVLIDVFDTTIISDRITVDPSGAKFTVQDAGRYLIGVNFACAPASNNTVITIGIHVNGSPTATVDIPILARTAGENVAIPYVFPVDGAASDTVDFRISIGAGTQTITFDEASAFIVQQAVGLATLEGAVEVISHQNEDGAETTYYVGADEAYSGKIQGIRLETDSGTLTYTVKINGTNVTGLVNIVSSSTKAETAATAVNTFVDGDTISYVTSSDSTSIKPRITIITTRT